MTRKSTVSLVYPVDLRKYNNDTNCFGNFSNEVPLAYTFQDFSNNNNANKNKKDLSLSDFIVSNNKKIQQSVDNGAVPFTFFQKVAERVMEVQGLSPHGIDIEMVSSEKMKLMTKEAYTCPALLPIGLESRLKIEHNLASNLVILNLNYKTCVLDDMKAEAILTSLVSLLTYVVKKPGCSITNLESATKGLGLKGDESCNIL